MDTIAGRDRLLPERPGRRETPGLRLQIFVKDDMIGGGKMDLLRLVARRGSVAAAAAEMGMDDARARFLLETLAACFEAPILEESDGAAALTPLGRELVARHDALSAEVAEVAAGFLDWVESAQRKG